MCVFFMRRMQGNPPGIGIALGVPVETQVGGSRARKVVELPSSLTRSEAGRAGKRPTVGPQEVSPRALESAAEPTLSSFTIS